MDIEQFIREYVKDIGHMSLGTCVDGKPWVCEVHFAYDDKLQLYFISSPMRRHSLEIATNPYVSGNIVKQHKKGEKPSGVYFEGSAKLLSGITPGSDTYKLYVKQQGAHPSLANLEHPEGPRFYKITVSDFYVFDATGKLGPPAKYHLSWKTK
jgi:uncharacterized protein YhbP (UPF0306 family)